MGTERGPDYYNSHTDRVNIPLEDSPWKTLYESAVLLLPPQKDCKVADIGCGTGRFARQLANLGYQNYWGIDFSNVRVEEAKKYVPEYTFEIANVFSSSVQQKFENHKVFVLLEVLEHLEDDILLISSLPAMSQVIISVPNYDSSGHVRFFETKEDVIDRYQHLLNFSEVEPTIIPGKRPEKKIFLFSTTRL